MNIQRNQSDGLGRAKTSLKVTSIAAASICLLFAPMAHAQTSSAITATTSPATAQLPDPYLGFFKLNVEDIDRVEAFFQSAFGFERVTLIELPTIEERILRLPDGKVSLVLYHHKDGRDLDVGTAHGPVGIVTRNVDKLHAAALAAGATERLAPIDLGPTRLSFLRTPEGHAVELINMSAQSDSRIDEAVHTRWSERIESKQAYTEAEMWPDFIALGPISTEEIVGTWYGGRFDGGSSPDPINWYGKRFTSLEDVEPLLVKRPDGSIGVYDKLGAARMREVEFKGEVSATIIYNNLPIMDYFRKVDDDTIIGWGEVKGDSPDFFFWLKREGS